MKTANMTTDVIIVGGGVVGLSAAIAMHQRGYSVRLIDAGSLEIDTITISPRVYAINHASQRLLEQLNVWKNLDQKRLSPYQKMHVWDASNKDHIDFDARMIATTHLGSIIDESNLRQALLTTIAATNIHLNANSSVIAVQEQNAHIDIRTETDTWTTPLLIVADGALSPTRKLLNVAITEWPYHQHALVATIQTEKSHQHTAYQVFTPEGPLAFLPLADEHQCSIVWSGPVQRTQQRLDYPDAVFNQQLATAFENTLGQTRLLSKRHTFPLTMRHVQQYVGKNWLLMGDAAHTIHPLAGLGLNVGLADLTTWLTLLETHHQGPFSKKTLQAYQRHRKHAVWQTIGLMEGIKALFLNPLPPIKIIRGLGLRWCNQFAPLKRLFIEHAAG